MRKQIKTVFKHDIELRTGHIECMPGQAKSAAASSCGWERGLWCCFIHRYKRLQFHENLVTGDPCKGSLTQPNLYYFVLAKLSSHFSSLKINENQWKSIY